MGLINQNIQFVAIQETNMDFDKSKYSTYCYCNTRN